MTTSNEKEIDLCQEAIRSTLTHLTQIKPPTTAFILFEKATVKKEEFSASVRWRSLGINGQAVWIVKLDEARDAYQQYLTDNPQQARLLIAAKPYEKITANIKMPKEKALVYAFIQQSLGEYLSFHGVDCSKISFNKLSKYTNWNGPFITDKEAKELLHLVDKKSEKYGNENSTSYLTDESERICQVSYEIAQLLMQLYDEWFGVHPLPLLLEYRTPIQCGQLTTPAIVFHNRAVKEAKKQSVSVPRM
eukprot:UN11108